MHPPESGQRRTPDAAVATVAAVGPADAPRHALVLFMIVATAAIFVGLFAILYFRWAGAEEPSSALLVAVSPAFDGASIEVDGMELPKPHKVIVGPRNNRTIPFYLHRGSYTLRVSRDDKPIYAAEFFISPNNFRRVDLQRLEHLLPPPPATAPSSTSPEFN